MKARTNSLKKSWKDKRRRVQPKTIQVAQEDLVEVGQLKTGQSLPVLIRPRMPSVDLGVWVRENMELVEENLRVHGGVLFRDFSLRGDEGFQYFLDHLPVELMHYVEGATPRTQLSDKVYTSTEFPADQAISLHNELCYVNTWPMKIMFFCDQAAQEQGETPIADVREVYRLVDPGVRQRFIDKGGWMLVRNFHEGFGLPWQVSYRVDDKDELECYFNQAQIDYEWLDGGTRLRTSQVRPVAQKHPTTEELVWFTHVGFWHISSLDPTVREVMVKDLHEDGLPYNTYYGDGTPIEDSAITAVRKAFDRATVKFPWQEGDLLLLDNMLVAHGRSPFKGPRRILTAMGQVCHRHQVQG